MLWEIVKKEFHSNIITARFIVGFIICLMLISASTYVAIRDYERRLNDYNVAVREHRDEVLNSKVYSEVNPKVDREPSRLSIFNQGMDRRLANTFEAGLSAVPLVCDGEKHGAYNPFLSLFSSIDLTFVFQVVLSLLALLFAYNAISGERENGTLKLMMSNSIPRSSVLIGKYLSALLSLFWPIAVSIIIALLMIMFSGKVLLTGGDFVRILLILVVSLLYVSAFYLIGLLISTKTQRTATSLMVAMFVWVFLTLIYPNGAGFLADRAIRSNPREQEFSQIQELWKEFERDRDKYKEKVVPEYSTRGSSSSDSRSSASSDTLFYSLSESMSVRGNLEPESSLDALKQFYQYQEPRRIRAADQTWQIRKQALDDSYGRKQRLTTNILRVSPAAIYENTSAALACTDLGSILDFVDQVQQYRRSFIGYLNDQKAFSSESWFWRGTREKENRPDLVGAPIFHHRAESISSSLGRGATDILLLIILNVVFFILSYTLFVRQEVK
jgi:ABC-type transport system involved in multi-copper enzyme maturation permease subunit